MPLRHWDNPDALPGKCSRRTLGTAYHEKGPHERKGIGIVNHSGRDIRALPADAHNQSRWTDDPIAGGRGRGMGDGIVSRTVVRMPSEAPHAEAQEHRGTAKKEFLSARRGRGV